MESGTSERSRLCVYGLAERKVKGQEVNDQAEPIAKIRKDSTCVPAISSVKRIDEYTLSVVKMELVSHQRNHVGIGNITPLESG